MATLEPLVKLTGKILETEPAATGKKDLQVRPEA
jgi:hypothetical protein